MVALFGTNDKTALTVFVVAARRARHRRRRRPAGAPVDWGPRSASSSRSWASASLASMRLAGSTVTLVLVSAAIQAGLAVYVLSALMTSAAGRRAPWSPIRRPRGARSSSGRRVLGGLAIVGGGLGRRMLEGRAAQVTAAATEIPPAVDPVAVARPGRVVRHRRADPARHAQRRLLPHRHRPDHARGRPQRLDAAGVRHGRPRGHADLRRPDGAAAHRALRHDRLREQRGRRQPRRQRQVDGRPPHRRARHGGRPARRDADRAALRRRLDGRASRPPG